MKGRNNVQTKYCKCPDPDCGQTNKVQIPENFKEKAEKFLESAPATTAQGLLSLALGIFVAPPVGLTAAGAMLAAAIFTDGTAKCTKCGYRLRIV